MTGYIRELFRVPDIFPAGNVDCYFQSEASFRIIQTFLSGRVVGLDAAEGDCLCFSVVFVRIISVYTIGKAKE